MTPAFIDTQQQLWSLWHTNTSLTPCHQGAFFHTGFRLTLKRFPEQYVTALYKEGRQPIVCMPGVSCVPRSNGSQTQR